DSALRAIPPEKFQGLPPEFLEQLHQTALRLSQAPLPHWKAGIWMGFQGAWPEFYGLALDHLADPELQNFITFHREGGEGTSSFIIADFFSKHSQEFPDDLVPKIEKAVSVVEESFVFSNLMKCLTDKKTSTTTEALLRLAKDERPWIWVSALKELSTRKALAPEESLTPPERIRLTVARALSGSLPEKTTLEPEVESALLTILSDGAKNQGPTWILDTLHRYDDPKTTLRAAVEFLQKQNPYGYRYNIWPIPTVTRWINQNYDVNIGELGTGGPNDLSYGKMSPTQLGKQITDTCTWYEQSEYFNGTPLKRPFFQNSPEEQAGETSETADSTSTPKDAPLDIRFIGFQTGLGDSLYNAEGEKIGERLNWPGVDFPKDKMNWRFLFELPKTDEFPLFERFPILCASGKSREPGGAVGGGSYYTGLEMEGQTRQLFYDLRIDREGKLPKAVDFCLRYFSGPPGTPLYSFSGPFEGTKH
ncbi:MAG TPA: hypothetical protein PKH31_13860, partial [Candidatus Sumerlaeota bacterium]|nr:hypothetical protein [Candidatus Sumerlaeota bacterium]